MEVVEILDLFMVSLWSILTLTLAMMVHCALLTPPLYPNTLVWAFIAMDTCIMNQRRVDTYPWRIHVTAGELLH